MGNIIIFRRDQIKFG